MSLARLHLSIQSVIQALKSSSGSRTLWFPVVPPFLGSGRVTTTTLCAENRFSSVEYTAKTPNFTFFCQELCIFPCRCLEANKCGVALSMQFLELTFKQNKSCFAGFRKTISPRLVKEYFARSAGYRGVSTATSLVGNKCRLLRSTAAACREWVSSMLD